MQPSKHPSKPRVLAIVGPTASGKTALAIRLARRFDGEIISADSRQIYRGMDIGTAKPKLISHISNLKSSEGILHHLIDIKNPNQSYTLAEYQYHAFAAIRKILRKKKVPILIGGTGLYVDAVVNNLDIPKVKPNAALRRRSEKELATKGLTHLFAELVRRDPEAAYIVDPKNPRRVIRALEVVLTSGKPFSAQRTRRAPLFETLKLGIAVPPDMLRTRIDARVDQMMRDGLVREVRGLVKKYGARQAAFDAIGYREVISYLQNKITLADAIAMLKRNTWQYAKRQMTWFRKDKETRWIKNQKEASVLAKNFLS